MQIYIIYLFINFSFIFVKKKTLMVGAKLINQGFYFSLSDPPELKSVGRICTL